MKALFMSMFLAVLLVSVVGCATHQPVRTPEIVLCSDCLVYSVYQSTRSAVIVVVGSHEIPEGREPNASELLGVEIARKDTQGVGPGMLVDLSNARVLDVRGMHSAYESVDFQNIHLALEQDFRDHGPRWKQLIEPLLDEAYRDHTD